MIAFLGRLERLVMTKGALPALWLLFLLPRIIIVCFDVEPTTDAAWYLHRAQILVAGGGYSEGGVPTAYWPPGYPLTMAVLFKIFTPSVMVAKLFNLACAAANAWFTLDLGRRIFLSEAGARLGLLLLAIYPNSIGYTALLLTETYFTTLFLAGCWTMLVWGGLRRILAAGVIFGLATLVKAQSFVVIPMLFAVNLLRNRIAGRALLSSSLQAAATILVCFAVVFPWTYRNHEVLGEWVVVSTNGGLTFLTGNNPSAQGDYTPDDPLVTSIARTVATQIQTDIEARRRGVEWIKANPGAFAILVPKKIFRLWVPDGEAEWFFQSGYAPYDAHVFLFRSIRGVNQVYYLALMVGFVVAGVRLATRRDRRAPSLPGWRWLPYLAALFPTLVAIVFSGQSRFHLPVMPLVTMTVGWLLLCDLRARPTATDRN